MNISVNTITLYPLERGQNGTVLQFFVIKTDIQILVQLSDIKLKLNDG